MKLAEIECKTALSQSSLPGLRYALNPYRGCGSSCIYCYAPAVLREKRPWGDFVEIKRNIPAVLSKELRLRAKGVVGIGTVTDAYQPIEAKYLLTRRSLQELLLRDFPVSIQSKSSLVTRDIDLLVRFSKKDVGFSISMLDERMRKIFEPRAHPIEERLRALQVVSSEGIDTWVFIGPILPGVTENDLCPLMDRIAEAGARKVMTDRLRLKPGIWQRMVQTLSRYPTLMEKHRKALWSRDSYFESTEATIRDLCEQRGLVHQYAFPSEGSK